MDRRTFGKFVAATMLATRPAFAAPAVDKHVKLTVMRPASDSDVRLMAAAIERFNKRFPSVEVKPQFVTTNPWGEYINQLMNLAGSGQTPDIITMPTEGVATVGSRNLLLDINALLDQDPAVRAEMMGDMEPNLLNGLKYKGKVILLPTEWNTSVVFYNRAIFDEAGVAPPKEDWTWDDFLTIAKKLTLRDAGGRTTRYAYFIPGKNFYLMPWFLTNDADRLSADGTKSSVRDPKFRETLVFLRSLVAEHKVSPAFVRNDAGDSAFIAGNVAMFSSSHSQTPALIKAKLKDWDVQTYPRKRSDTRIMGVLGVGVTRASKEPELAWELVRELSSKEYEMAMAANLRGTPSRRSAATSGPFAATPRNAQLFYSSATRSVPLVAPPNFAQVEDIMMRHVDAYLNGNSAIDPTIDALDTELARAMSRVR